MIEEPLYLVKLLTLFCDALAFSSGLTSTAAGAGAAIGWCYQTWGDDTSVDICVIRLHQPLS